MTKEIDADQCDEITSFTGLREIMVVLQYNFSWMRCIKKRLESINDHFSFLTNY